MNDVLPAEATWWRRFFRMTQEAMDRYGYHEIQLPIVEQTELFKRSVGEATDIVEKEMFTFLDREKTSMTLRPEGTAGCVRAGVEHGFLHNQQQRLWYRGPMFRHERPQAGRYRQFTQVGVEAFGVSEAEMDIEVIALSARILRALGLVTSMGSAVRLELNTLGSPEARAAYRTALVDFLHRNEDRLDEDSKRRMHLNPLRVLDSKNPHTRDVLEDAPSLVDFLDWDSKVHFGKIEEGLRSINIDYTINPRIVRGLDYYNRTVFEWVTDHLGSQGAVCAGGRYDGLVGQLGGGDVPAVGWAMGVERIIQLCKVVSNPAGYDEPVNPQFYVCWQGDGSHLAALRLAERLRSDTLGPDRKGLRVLLNAGGGKLKSQLTRADRSGALYALILGEDETTRQVVQVKSLRDSSPQTECPWPELPARLASLLNFP
jgi:histidyl-tRNA synthetase